MTDYEVFECETELEMFDDADPSAFAHCSCGWSELCPGEDSARVAALMHQQESDAIVEKYKDLLRFRRR